MFVSGTDLSNFFSPNSYLYAATHVPRGAPMSVAPAQTQRFMRHESWSNALFVHWAVDAAVLSALLPPQLEPDLFEGRAYVGLVLLGENGIRPHCGGCCTLPRALAVSHLAANVRTYVRLRGGGGGSISSSSNNSSSSSSSNSDGSNRSNGDGSSGAIFFFSLDCSSVLATLGAAAAFSLPYRLARIKHSAAATGRGGTAHSFQAARERWPALGSSSAKGGAERGAHCAVRARWTCHPDDPVDSSAGTFAHFAVERYHLYTLGCGVGTAGAGFAVVGGYGLPRSTASGSAAMGLFRGSIRHRPWRLCAARLQLCETTALEAAGLDTPRDEPLVFAAAEAVEGIDFWLFQRVG